MARSTHPRYTAADLYERRQARLGKRYKRSQRLVSRAIRESQEAI
jgi:hypothetical protein